MNLADITPELLESTLRALRGGRPPGGALLALMEKPGRSREEAILALEDMLYELLARAYAEQRQVENLPEASPVTRQDALAQIAEDFRSGNANLEAWSALTVRYLSPAEVSVEDLARAAGVVPQQLRRRLRQGLELAVQRIRRWALKESQMLQPAVNLPLPDYTHLVGAEPWLQRLTALFADPAGPRLVSLEGIGGIGKTALARAFAGQPAPDNRWKEVLWVSARQSVLSDDGRVSPVMDAAASLDDITGRLCEQMSLAALGREPLAKRLDGLKGELNQRCALVVVDNLETLADSVQLIPALASIGGCSRFLLTSRHTLRDYAFVHTLPLRELTAEQALALMNSEITRRGRTRALTPDQFAPFYAALGGLPLAIKLAAAQVSLSPLSEILAGFRQAARGIEGLYHYLYWRTWRALTDPARHLLLSFLPADPEGEDLEFLHLMSGQGEDQFAAALRELDQFSLLEIAGDPDRPRVRLHRLTTTFLQTEILKLWS